MVRKYGFGSAMIHQCLCANVEVYIYLFTFSPAGANHDGKNAIHSLQ